MATKTVPAPGTLGESGKKLWREIVGTYELRADELRALEDACAATDMIAALTKAWAELGKPFMSKGSMGQEVEHPLIGSIDKQRKARQAFLGKLKLPDDAGDDAGSGTPPGDDRANQARAAANARWSRRGA